MLILSRGVGEQIVINDRIIVSILEIEDKSLLFSVLSGEPPLGMVESSASESTVHIRLNLDHQYDIELEDSECVIKFIGTSSELGKLKKARIGVEVAQNIPVHRMEVYKAILRDQLQATPLELLIDPGSATTEQIAELYFEISKLYRMMGGAGVDFRVVGAREPSFEGVSL